MCRQSIRMRSTRRIVAGFLCLTPVLGCGVSGDASVASSGSLAEEPTSNPAGIRPGIDVLLADSIHLVRGRRVGLITNHTGIGSDGVSSIDRLAAQTEVELVSLFSPEHGIRGGVEAGEQVADQIDARTGLPIHSLYGPTRKPSPEMLNGLDALLFDIQDIGTRYYTYVSTMALAMEAAGESSIPFIVLDRPNPLGGQLVQGNLLEPAFASFVGRYPIPMRHGMTPGELARLFRGAFGVQAQLHVVPVAGWSREMLFSDTGLPWRAPSPNMPDLESAFHYPGTCLFEGTNLSVGRGTDRPFQWVGAPWLDGEELRRALEELALPGVRFHPASFTPREPGDGKFDGVEVQGVRLEVLDAKSYDPTLTALALLVQTRRMSGERWEWLSEHFDRLAGTQRIRAGVEQSETPEAIAADWAGDLEGFRELRDPYLIYR